MILNAYCLLKLFLNYKHNVSLQDPCPDFPECLNCFALIFWLAGYKFHHPIISDLVECKFHCGTVAIRWHMTIIIRIWQISVNSCILFMLAFAWDRSVGGQTDYHQCINCQFAEMGNGNTSTTKFLYRFSIGVMSLRPSVFIDTRQFSGNAP